MAVESTMVGRQSASRRTTLLLRAILFAAAAYVCLIVVDPIDMPAPNLVC